MTAMTQFPYLKNIPSIKAEITTLFRMNIGKNNMTPQSSIQL